jgi:ABC-type branched-subunit amino acid transport system substrate-binding protein
MGAVLLLAAGWASIVWSRPTPIRIAFANSLTGPSGPAGLESLVATRLAIDEVNRQRRDQGPAHRTRPLR